MHDRVRDRVERLCSSPSDERSFRSSILAEIRRAVGFDAYVWLLTDPATAVGCAPLADVPCLSQLPKLIKLKYLTTINRWTSLSADTGPVGLLVRTTGGELARSIMWRDLLQDFGVGDIASVAFADRHGSWGFLDLWRQGGDPFLGADADLLAELVSPICTALRRSQAAAFALAKTLPSPVNGPAVIVLDDDLQITGRTTAATEWLRSLLPTPPGQAPIPAAAYNVAAQLLAIESGIDDHPPSATAYVPGRTWVTLRASRLESAEQVAGGAIAVSIEETAAGPRLDLFGRSHGLTARERQLLALLGRGADTREIADEMGITDYTVQDHLKSVFSKTSLTSRSALITTAIGPRAETR